jgi:hypothetical protein
MPLGSIIDKVPYHTAQENTSRKADVMGLRTNKITVDSKLLKINPCKLPYCTEFCRKEAVLCCNLLHITVTSTLHNLYEITKQKTEVRNSYLLL